MHRHLAATTAPLARTPEEWAEAVGPSGGRPFHGRQIFRWVHARGVLEADRMTDLPKELRGQLATLAMDRAVEIADERRSADDTRKLLVRLRDGATVETVLIPGVSGAASDLPPPVLASDLDADAAAAVDDEEEDEGSAAPDPHVRVTQCISTQVGCAMGCVFCASGVAGLKRHLGPDEIVG